MWRHAPGWSPAVRQNAALCGRAYRWPWSSWIAALRHHLGQRGQPIGQRPRLLVGVGERVELLAHRGKNVRVPVAEA